MTSGSDRPHPLAAMLAAAATGVFPPVDGVVEVHPPDTDGTGAIVEFTGHSVVLTDRDPTELVRRGADGFGGVIHPDVVRWLAGPKGWIGTHDVVLVGRGTGGGPLPVRDDLFDHPRVVRARAHRRDVVVLGDERGFVTLGTGLVGRREISVELLGPGGTGAGRALIDGGLGASSPGELVWAQVSPGNAASLRAFLAAGFTPIGAEILLAPGQWASDQAGH